MSFYSIAPFIQQFYTEYYSIETYPVPACVTIRKVRDEWGVFSNFAPTPIVIGGIQFKNAEQLFQLMKFRDAEPVMAVYTANNPKMTAKHWEKTHRRDDWGWMIVDAMKFVLQQKYEQCLPFREALERSKGHFIVEDQTTFPKKNADTWGVKRQGDTYVGPNLFGRLLMELRDNGALSYQLPEDALAFTRLLTDIHPSATNCL